MDNKNIAEYIVSLADISEHEIVNNMCVEDFPYHQLILTDKDGYTISQGSTEESFAAGDVIYASEGRRFGIRCDGTMKVRHIAFYGRKIRPLLHYCDFNEFRVIHIPDKNGKIADLFDEVFKLDVSKHKTRDVKLSAAVYELISCVGAINIENGEYVFDSKDLVLKQIINFMQQNYTKPLLNKNDFIKSLKMTGEEVDALFEDVFSMTADEYFFKLRMDYAKQLLFHFSRYEIDVAAGQMGYKSVKQFEMDFYKQFYMTPHDFLELYPRNI